MKFWIMWSDSDDNEKSDKRDAREHTTEKKDRNGERERERELLTIKEQIAIENDWTWWIDNYEKRISKTHTQRLIIFYKLSWVIRATPNSKYKYLELGDVNERWLIRLLHPRGLLSWVFLEQQTLTKVFNLIFSHFPFLRLSPTIMIFTEQRVDYLITFTSKQHTYFKRVGTQYTSHLNIVDKYRLEMLLFWI